MKRKIMNKLDGFTLVEILIVVVIVGILAAIAIPTYYSYVQKGYASDAKVQIQNMVKSAEIFRNETGDYPGGWEEMEEQGYIDIPQSVKNKWDFEISLDEDGVGGTISATSTEQMSGGQGKRVAYDKREGKFTGYGQGGSDS